MIKAIFESLESLLEAGGFGDIGKTDIQNHSLAEGEFIWYEDGTLYHRIGSSMVFMFEGLGEPPYEEADRIEF